MNRKEEYQIWNQLSGLYESKFMNLNLYDSSYEFFLGRLPHPSSAVLDIGCGPGIISRFLQNRMPQLNITGIDYSEEMIRLASANIPEGRFMVMDCRVISQIREHFEGIVCGFVLPYLSESELKPFIRDLSNLLKNRGVAYLSLVEGLPEASGPVTGSSGHTVYFHYHIAENLINELKINNMKLVQEFRFNYPGPGGTTQVHTVFIAEKCL